MEKEFYVELEHIGVEASTAAAVSMKCRQIAAGVLYHGKGAWTHIHDAKIDALRSVIEEAWGMPLLVSYVFKADLEKLLRAFPFGRVLDGDPRTQAAWNRGEIPLMFAHPASCGHGLNLQDGSNQMCFYTLDFNLETFQQMAERLGPVRQFQSGHDRPVVYHYIIAQGTVEERVYNVLTGKATFQDEFKRALVEFRDKQKST
jgi:hypothetical protein